MKNMPMNMMSEKNAEMRIYGHSMEKDENSDEFTVYSETGNVVLKGNFPLTLLWIDINGKMCLHNNMDLFIFIGD